MKPYKPYSNRISFALNIFVPITGQEIVYLKSIHKNHPNGRFCVGNHQSKKVSEKNLGGASAPVAPSLDPPMRLISNFILVETRTYSWVLHFLLENCARVLYSTAVCSVNKQPVSYQTVWKTRNLFLINKQPVSYQTVCFVIYHGKVNV